MNKNTKLYKMFYKLFSNSYSVFLLFILSCVFIHTSLAIFAIILKIRQLFIINSLSVLSYFISIIFIKKRPLLIYVIACIEIFAHTYFTTLLIGFGFGFELYCLFIVPLTYHVLYLVNVKKHAFYSSIIALVTFTLFIYCYLVSLSSVPYYVSNRIDNTRPIIYVINISILFIALAVYSLWFIEKTSSEYTTLVNENQKLDIKANTDPLTGLYNKQALTSHIENLYNNQNKEKLFSLIICDIDDFKKINDTYGHDFGDKVLTEISKTFKYLSRSTDLLCRWGGEEFVIVLDNIDKQTAHIIAERLRESISQKDIMYMDKPVNITMTFGISTSNEYSNYNDLFRKADERLYIGKNSGKNKVV